MKSSLSPMPRGNKNLRGKTGNMGGGLLPAAFAIRARARLEKAKAIDVAGQVIEGKEGEERMTKEGTVVALKPAISDRLAAIKLLAEMGKVLTREPENPEPPEHRALPVEQILAALGAHVIQEAIKHPHRGARVKMLQAIEGEATVVD